MMQMYALAVLLVLSSPAFGQLMCSGSLPAKFDKNLKTNDANSDGFVTGIEIYNDFKNNYDTDNDGCVTVKEWVNRTMSFYSFTQGYATKRLADIAPDMSVACTIKYDVYQTMNISIPVDAFMSANVQSLIDLCKSNSTLTKTNCDCSQLQASCNSSSISATGACKNYVNTRIYGEKCDGKGLLGDRFQSNQQNNDPNSDGFVTGTEIFYDFKDHYDVNHDGCVSVKEWTDRWQSYFKFSEAYAKQRMMDVVPDMSAACTISYSFYLNNTNINIPSNAFLQDNIESLVKLCRSDSDLFNTNCDCAQLYTACKSDALMEPGVVCKSYIASPVVVGP